MTKTAKPGIQVAAGTDIGKVRTANEDAYLVDDRIGLIAVADGMGGHANGALASRLALEVLSREMAARAHDLPAIGADDRTWVTWPPPENVPDAGLEKAISIVEQSVHAANLAILAQNRQQGLDGRNAMGTTLSGFFFHREKPRNGVIFHVGDSRIYRFRQGKLKQLTRDDTQYQAWIDAGRQGAEPPRNVVLQALGPAPNVKPSVFVPHFEPGDKLLVCSDGLSDFADAAIIVAEMTLARPDSLDTTCARLIEAANDAGGRDNITAILAVFG
jgi:serine/threonine protein phosphatase PrpC